MDSSTKKKVLIVTNNQDCKGHVQYIAAVEKYFIKNGWDVVGGFAGFDAVVICACGYHEAQYRKVLRIVDKFVSMNFPEKDIFILGCLPGTHDNQIRQAFRGTTVTFGDERILDEVVAARVPFERIDDENVLSLCDKDENIIERTFYIRIATGCLGECTFCVIKRAKGRLRSFPSDRVQSQYKKASGLGFRKVELIGEDTFAYGLDIGTNIIELIESLLEIDDDMEILFDQLDMKWLLKYSSKIMSLCKRGVFKRLGIGMQHNNEWLLRRMGRNVDFDRVYEVLKKLKQENPTLYIAADILVGFPGETRDMFDQLVEFLRKDTTIDSIKHAGYSDNKNAPSYTHADKVDSLEIAERWNYIKDTLKEKCLYNYSDSPISNEGAAYQKSFNEELIICKNTFVEV
jgi:ribosomal protein S12 methylthiotransferase